MATFEQLMDGFGVVTVMNACIYELKGDKRYTSRAACQHAASTGGALVPTDWVCTGEYLDTLKIANLNQEGPTKTITGGQYANPLIKYGKTTTMEMQDALGRASTMVRFFGADYEENVVYTKKDGKRYTFPKVGNGTATEFYILQGKASAALASGVNITIEDKEGTAATATAAYDEATKGLKITLNSAPAEGDAFTIVMTVKADDISVGSGRLSITDKFPGAFAIEGDSFFIDQKTGDKVDVHILIPQFLPDAILNFTQDAEGDATVFDLNGTAAITKIADAAGLPSRDVFYEIRNTRFFEGVEQSANHK